jgi:spoIIIJ-associated protein
MFNLFKDNPATSSDTVLITDDMKSDAKLFIETILTHAELNAVVAINNDATGVLHVMIQDDYDTARIIGKDGQTLQSLYLLLQSFLSKKYDQYVPVFVDCNDYFSYRIEKAESKAKELEKQLCADRPSIELFPMSSLERRAIHTLYTNHPKISTHSLGQGHDRRIVLTLK